MKTIFRLLLLLVLSIGAYQYCTHNKMVMDFYHHSYLGKFFYKQNIPATGNFNSLPMGLVDHQDTVYAQTAIWYHQYLNSHKLCTNPDTIALVKSVTDKLIPAAKQYMADMGLSDRFNKFNWEVNVVESKEVNAWCAAGGKIVVYTGILKYTGKDANKLATVLGHEISHALEDHTIKQGNREKTFSKVGSFLANLISKKIKNKNIVKYASQELTKIGARLPFSRAQERQADHVGIELMEIAGFDINKAIDFWQDMGSGEGKYSNLLAVLSDHPSDTHRVDLIKKEVSDIHNKGIAYVEKQDNYNFQLLASL